MSATTVDLKYEWNGTDKMLACRIDGGRLLGNDWRTLRDAAKFSFGPTDWSRGREKPPTFPNGDKRKILIPCKRKPTNDELLETTKEWIFECGFDFKMGIILPETPKERKVAGASPAVIEDVKKGYRKAKAAIDMCRGNVAEAQQHLDDANEQLEAARDDYHVRVEFLKMNGVDPDAL